MRIFSPEAFNFRQQLRDFKKISSLAVAGMFVALYIVLSYLKIPITPSIEIRFAFLALAMAGCYGGPLMGLFVGAASDVLGMILTAGGGAAFFFGFTISYSLAGFLFGMCFYKRKITALSVIPATLFYFLIGVTLNTLWLHMMYGMPLRELAWTRLLKELAMLPVNFVMLYLVLKALVQVVVRSGFMQSRRA